MPAASRVPKLNLGRRISKPRPTKAMSAETKDNVKKGVLIVCGLLFLTGLTLMILEAAGVKIFSKKKKTLSVRPNTNHHVSKQKRKMRSPWAVRGGIDRRVDMEEPVVSPTALIDANPNQRAPPRAAPQSFTPPAGIDRQFQSFDPQSMQDQFAKSAKPPKQQQAVKSSQLRRDTLFPSFSVDKQPSRQVGLAVDMVFNDLRKHESVPKTVSSQQVLFGGSEYQEMVRSKSVGSWKEHY